MVGAFCGRALFCGALFFQRWPVDGITAQDSNSEEGRGLRASSIPISQLVYFCN
jgi:hypothetical protein